MKKSITKAAAIIAAMGALSFSAFADVYVTIADENGGLPVPQFGIELTDADGDGALTINDALIIAHDKYYSGGAEAGYGSAEGDFGLMMTKLWGVENGGSYGYYVNNASAMSLADPLNDGDYLNAFIYTDTTAWSDTYCYFDKHDIEAEGNSENPAKATLKLTAAAFDENWSPINVPVEGARITLSGSPTDYYTDANGEVEITFPPREGSYVISAVSDTQTLVPPVCIATVRAVAESAAEEGAAEESDAASAGDVSAAGESSKGSPDTGIADAAVVSGCAVIALGAFMVSKKRK